MYEPNRYRVFSRFCPGNNNPFGAWPPEVIQNDIDSIAAELLCQGILKRIGLLQIVVSATDRANRREQVPQARRQLVPQEPAASASDPVVAI